MRREQIVLMKIEADEGNYLTNGEVFGKTIYLGKNDKEENWAEITEAEYEKVMSEKGENKNEVHT